jgi:hypothetical protein
MDLDKVWLIFLDQLMLSKNIETAYWKKVAGIPFLYIKVSENVLQSKIDNEIIQCSANAMKGKRLHCQTIFVRREATLFVYRHRFLVPQEKMFCCGNLCTDCIRFKK